MLDARSNQEFYSLYACKTCQSYVFYPPPTSPQFNLAKESIPLKTYLELLASVEGILSNLVPLVGHREAGRFLDVGCGYGFSVDIVRRISNWHAVGVEPGNWGEVGAKELEIEIHNALLEHIPKHQLEHSSFDVIYSSDVIEHVDDPNNFVSLLRRYLTDDGILALTTPNAEFLATGSDESTLLRILSPGSHMFILNANALRKILQKAGFIHVDVRVYNHALVAYASDAPINKRLASQYMKKSKRRQSLIRYLSEVLEHAPKGSSLATGMTARLFASYISIGDYHSARTLLDSYPQNFPEIEALKHADKADSIRDILSMVPTCAGDMYFHLGMLALKENQPRQAHDAFTAARQFFDNWSRVAPSLAMDSESRRWDALYYHGITSMEIKDYVTATKNMTEIAKANNASEVVGPSSPIRFKAALRLAGLSPSASNAVLCISTLSSAGSQILSHFARLFSSGKQYLKYYLLP